MNRGIQPKGVRAVDISQPGITTLPRLLAIEVLLSEPEALQDDVLESCLYILRDRLNGIDDETSHIGGSAPIRKEATGAMPIIEEGGQME